MTDPTNPDATPEPTVVSSEPADPTAATSGPAAGVLPPVPEAALSTAYTGPDPDLQNAKGDAVHWANELASMIGHTTNVWIEATTFVPWFQTYADQVKVAEDRAIAFDLANLTIGEAITGDAGTLLLDLRNEMSLRVRKRAGLV